MKSIPLITEHHSIILYILYNNTSLNYIQNVTGIISLYVSHLDTFSCNVVTYIFTGSGISDDSLPRLRNRDSVEYAKHDFQEISSFLEHMLLLVNEVILI